MRSYRLYINDKWWSFNTLIETCKEFLSRCKSLGLLDIADTGEKTCTMYRDKEYYKRYTVICYVPYTVIEIRKLSSGNLDYTRLKECLKFLKEKYYD